MEQIENLWDKIQSLEERIEQLEKLNTSSQTDENGKLLTYWGGLKDRTCNNSCSVVCGECQLLTSSQTEISDEEIEEYAMGYYNNNGGEYYVRLGAKWYREQLNNK